jgi:ketosteroid isomerase-like protein
MKKILIAFASLTLLFSCNESKVAGASEDNDHSKNSASSREVYRAVETGDVSKLDEVFTDDVIDYNGAPDGSDIVGREPVKAEIAKIHTYFENLKMNVISESTSQDGNYHFAMVNMKGKAKENPWGMPVGMDMDETMVDVMKMKDGKAAEHWGFMSMGDINEMMKGMSGGQAPAKDSAVRKP